jgi:MFS family permease
VFAAVGTIFIGAVGSGVWELLIRRLTLGLFPAVASAMGRVSESYLDYLHSDIGRANHTGMLGFLFFGFVVAIIMLNIASLIFFILFRRWRDSEEERPFLPRPPRLSNRLIWLAMLISVINVLSYSHRILESGYNEQATTWIERSIDILHPAVPESTYLSWRSKFRAIESASAFYSLRTDLLNAAVQSNTRLPVFHPIGGP